VRKILAEITIDFPGEETIPYQELEEIINDLLSPPFYSVESDSTKSKIKFIRVTFNDNKKKKKKKKKKFVHLPSIKIK
jgi:hypothetical protein